MTVLTAALAPPSHPLPTAFAQAPPDLSITKSHDGAYYVGSTNTRFIFDLHNAYTAGPANGGITLRDPLPPGITFNSIVSQSGAGTWSCSGPYVVMCTNPGPMPTNGYSYLAIKVDIGAAAVGEQSNSVTVSTPGESNVTDNRATDTVTVTALPGPPDLKLVKSHQGQFYVNSPSAVYVMQIVNNAGGPTTAPLNLEDPLPTGMTYNSITMQSGGWTCSGTTTVSCTNPGPLLTDGNNYLFVKVDVAPAAAGQRSNTATVSTQGETNLANNSSTDTLTVASSPPFPDLRAAKSHTGDFTVGSANAQYYLAASNLGGPTTGSVTLTDVLPTGITYNSIVSQSGNWACSGPSTVSCTNTGSIASGATSWVVIRVNLTPAAVGQRSNTVTVVTADDANPDNNTSQPDVVTVAPLLFPLTVTKYGAGSGTVTSTPPGINCGSDCAENYVAGTVVTLTASPIGSYFAGWSGACSGSGTCQATMNSSKGVTATFQKNNVGVQVQPVPGIPPSGGKTLLATLTARAGCGPIQRVVFGVAGHPFDNARVTVTTPGGGPANQTTGFTYTPPSGTTSTSFTIQRVAPSGGATVNPIHFVDGCGDWVTFVGGGPNAFH
ncbi:MAG: hypothetical protein U0893_04365 [Chloroflexota bacterium]